MDAMLHTVRAIRDHGIAIIMIEHVMRAIMSVSDHVVVLDHGEMIAQGSPREVAENTQVVEAYLGRPEDAERLQEEV
jgi:ABC-type branched-subunit amino acid transport system ATPase component